MNFYETHCCALYEMDLLGLKPSAEEAMKEVQRWAVGKSRYEKLPTMMLFTGVTRRRATDHTLVKRDDDYGRAFQDYIFTHKLGAIVETPETVNPKTANGIKAWIWTPNWNSVFQLDFTASQ